MIIDMTTSGLEQGMDMWAEQENYAEKIRKEFIMHGCTITANKESDITFTTNSITLSNIYGSGNIAVNGDWFAISYSSLPNYYEETGYDYGSGYDCPF